MSEEETKIRADYRNPYHVSISGSGECAKYMVMKALGTIPEESEESKLKMKLAGREGDRHEYWIKRDLHEIPGLEDYESLTKDSEHYCVLCDRDGIHIQFELEPLWFVGHYDDRILNHLTGELFFGEYKALGKYTGGQLHNAGLAHHRKFLMQISLYHVALGLDCIYVLKSRDSGAMERLEVPHYYDIQAEVTRRHYMAQCVESGFVPPCDLPSGDIGYWNCRRHG